MDDKPIVAFGPESKKPSWDWVGFDIGRELSKYFHVIFFGRNTKQIPQCDVVLFIKTPPATNFLQNLNITAKILYCPIDHYATETQIRADSAFLEQCETILIHSKRLQPVFQPYCKAVEFIEHHNRFGLTTAIPFRAKGYIVWAGGKQHLPYIIRWLRQHPLGIDIKFVTDYSLVQNETLRNVFPIHDEHEIIKWSPRTQYQVMQNAKAAFDIKGLDFQQMTKPPVKSQKFIVSGIPFATNSENYATEYFNEIGLRIPSPTDVNQWFSEEYWKSTAEIGGSLKQRLTLENIGLMYKTVIEKALHIQ